MQMSGRLHTAALTPGERAQGTHWTRGWVGRSVDLDAVAKRKNFASVKIRTTVVQIIAYLTHRLSNLGSHIDHIWEP
jgi:hypothetical protein